MGGRGGGIPIVSDVVKGAMGMVSGVTGLIMGGGQDQGSAAAPPPPPPSPTSDPAEKKKAEDAANAAAETQRKASGRGKASTMLTGGQGDTSKATVSRRTLLGG